MGSSPWRSWTHKRPRTRSESTTWLILSAGWRYLGETCRQFIQLRRQKLTTSITPYASDNRRRCPRQPHVGGQLWEPCEESMFTRNRPLPRRRLGDRWTVGGMLSGSETMHISDCICHMCTPYGLTTRTDFIFAKGFKLHFSLSLKRGITLRHTLPPKWQNNKPRVL